MKFWPFSRKSNEDGSVRHSLDLFRLLAGWMGTKSGASVSHKSALEVPAVLSCVRVISEGVAQVPFKVYRQVGACQPQITRFIACCTASRMDG